MTSHQGALISLGGDVCVAGVCGHRDIIPGRSPHLSVVLSHGELGYLELRGYHGGTWRSKLLHLALLLLLLLMMPLAQTVKLGSEELDRLELLLRVLQNLRLSLDRHAHLCHQDSKILQVIPSQMHHRARRRGLRVDGRVYSGLLRGLVMAGLGHAKLLGQLSDLLAIGAEPDSDWAKIEYPRAGSRLLRRRGTLRWSVSPVGGRLLLLLLLSCSILSRSKFDAKTSRSALGLGRECWRNRSNRIATCRTHLLPFEPAPEAAEV